MIYYKKIRARQYTLCSYKALQISLARVIRVFFCYIYSFWSGLISVNCRLLLAQSKYTIEMAM